MLASAGRMTSDFFAATGRVVSFAVESVWRGLTTAQGISGSIAQTRILTFRCVVPVILVAMPIGMMLSLQTLALSQTFGVDRLLPPLVAATIVRELGPGFAAVMVCFQAGAGIAAELGSMRVNEELDALSVMGVDTRSLVAGPRVIGAAFASALLNAAAIATGIGGAYLVAVPLSGMAHTMFVDTLFEGLTVADVWLSEIKCFVFGLAIGAISVTFGFHADRGPAGVGRAANRTVVASVIVVLIANYLVNTSVFGLRGGGVAL
jgi:phospholipid/cholesterol/gamma-HCH transport system permease protein